MTYGEYRNEYRIDSVELRYTGEDFFINLEGRRQE